VGGKHLDELQIKFLKLHVTQPAHSAVWLLHATPIILLICELSKHHYNISHKWENATSCNAIMTKTKT
jgi:hypothetical protein